MGNVYHTHTHIEHLQLKASFSTNLPVESHQWTSRCPEQWLLPWEASISPPPLLPELHRDSVVSQQGSSSSGET